MAVASTSCKQRLSALLPPWHQTYTRSCYCLLTSELPPPTDFLLFSAFCLLCVTSCLLQPRLLHVTTARLFALRLDWRSILSTMAQEKAGSKNASMPLRHVISTHQRGCSCSLQFFTLPRLLLHTWPAAFPFQTCRHMCCTLLRDDASTYSSTRATAAA